MVSITFTPRPTKSNAKPMLVKGHVSPLSSFYRNIQLKMNRVEITTQSNYVWPTSPSNR